VKRFLRYYGQVLSFAFRNAWGATGFAGTVLSLIGPLIIWEYPDWNQTMTNLIWQIPLVLFASGLVFLLLLAPWRMHETQTQQLAAADGRLVVKDSEHAAAVTKMTEQIAKLQESLDQAEARHREEVERVRRSDPHRNAIRSRLEESISRFEQIKAQATAGQQVSIKDLIDVDHDASRLVEKETKYTRYSEKFPVRGMFNPNECPDSTYFLDLCADRIARLRDILTWFQ
jgi:hypothetical protein